MKEDHVELEIEVIYDDYVIMSNGIVFQNETDDKWKEVVPFIDWDTYETNIAIKIKLEDFYYWKIKPLAKLVAKTFIKNPYNYKYIKHINGYIDDNSVKNLQWVKNKKEALIVDYPDVAELEL